VQLLRRVGHAERRRQDRLQVVDNAHALRDVDAGRRRESSGIHGHKGQNPSVLTARLAISQARRRLQSA
jgi:hypothetical protein